MPSRNISLNDYMKQLIKAHNADIDTEGTPEEFDMTLCEHLFDGPETIEGLLAEHYTLSWALASLRDSSSTTRTRSSRRLCRRACRPSTAPSVLTAKTPSSPRLWRKCRSSPKLSASSKSASAKYDTPFNRETQEVYSNIEEETADVFIMLVQLFAIFNPHELVNITKIVWDKLDRLKDNLDKETAKQEASDAGKE